MNKHLAAAAKKRPSDFDEYKLDSSDEDIAPPPPKKPAQQAAAKAKKPATKKLKSVVDLDDDDVKPVAKPKAKPKPKKAPAAAAAAKKGKKKNAWGGSDSSGEDADMVDLGKLYYLVHFFLYAIGVQSDQVVEYSGLVSVSLPVP